MQVNFDQENHIYTDDKNVVYPSVTNILEHFGFIDYSGVPKHRLEKGSNFGTVFHFLAKLNDTGEINKYDYDPAIEPWLNGLRKFNEQYKPEWKVIEEPMISEIWKFAGTPDRWGRVLIGDTVADFKTGEEEHWHGLQTAGYEVLLEEAGHKVKTRLTVYIKPDGFSLEQHKNKSDRNLFLGLVGAYHYKQRRGLL